MVGTIRSYNTSTRDLVKNKVKLIAETTAVAFGCEAEVDLNDMYPPTVNHKIETTHVVRIASEAFGPERVKT
jgi:metal-dependent amidase/aminoacylase/carboxypeptidase family protein